MGFHSDVERERLFDLFASNLTAHAPDLKDIFVCPLCLSAHGQDSLAGADPRLTLEHCIPKSLGARILILSCRECNNLHGRTLDWHLKKRLVAEDAFEGIGGTVDGTMTIGGHSYRCMIGFSGAEERAFSFRPVEKALNPKDKRAAFAIIEECSRTGGDLGGMFSLRPGYAELPWRVALIKSAYLLMFRQFGYSYVFLDGPEFVRRLILDPIYETVAAATSFKPRVADTPFANRALIVTSPDELRCFLVPVQVRTSYRTQIKFVILPGFDDNPTGIYERWGQRGRQGHIGDVKFTGFDLDPGCLSDPDRFGALSLWGQTFGQPPRRVRLEMKKERTGHD